MSFWDAYDDRPIDVHPGQIFEQRQAVPTTQPTGVPSAPRCSQNDLTGVCDHCGIASDDVLLGVCADCA